MPRPLHIAVCGASRAEGAVAALSRRVGELLAGAGARVICGGRGGVMEAVARGAAEAGGEVIGIVPGEDPDRANRFVTHPVAAGVGHPRNLAVVASADAVIAVGGAWGTLSEVALARVVGRGVVLLRVPLAPAGIVRDDDGVHEAPDPEKAVALAVRLAEGRRGGAG